MSNPTQRRCKGFSVVVAEEDPDLRQTFVTALTTAGFSVRDVCSGQEALRVAREQHPDALVTNLRLSDMDGVELTQEINSDPETRDIPVVGVSCVPSGDRERIAHAGFAQVMVNSCGPQHLVADIRGVLSEHHPRNRRSRRMKRR